MENSDNTKVFDLRIEHELHFVVDAETSDVTLQLISGFAEILGTELILNKVYAIPPSSSISLHTWQGCSVKISGRLESEDVSAESLNIVTASMHACLQDRRLKAEFENTTGPVSLVVGPTDVGKTAFCYTLLNYAARMGKRPVFVDLDVGQSTISMPGSICVLPVEKPSDVTDGFCQKSLSVYPFGHKSPGHNIQLYFLLIKKLGQMIKNRMKNANPNTRSSGLIIDTCGWVRGQGYSAITLAACSFEIDVLFVIEEERLYLQLKKDMPSSVEIVYVPKQYNVNERDRALRAKNRDKRIWEYFYGPRGNLNPHVIEVNFANIEIYRAKPPPNSNNINVDSECIDIKNVNVESVQVGVQLEQCVLGLSFADKVDENLMLTNIIGYVCVTEVDMIKKVVTLLSPQPGPLPSTIFLLGEMRLRNHQTDEMKLKNQQTDDQSSSAVKCEN